MPTANSLSAAIDLDEEGFNREMEAQRARARAAQNFKANAQLDYTGADTEFTGYEKRSQDTKIIALYKGSEAVDELQAGEAGVVVLEQTPFYAESGGQVGDVGYIFAGENRFEVRDTQKIKAAVFGQFGVQTSGRLKAVFQTAFNMITDRYNQPTVCLFPHWLHWPYSPVWSQGHSWISGLRHIFWQILYWHW